MYWVVLACALLFESWAGIFLAWYGDRIIQNAYKHLLTTLGIRIPLYPWIRLGFLLYLILPQTQGAKVLYQEHVHPFLHDNEVAIDDFISSAHDRAKAAGITYLKHIVELIKQHVFGLPPKEPTPPPTPSTFTYTQSLMARFNLPSARSALQANPVSGATSTATDFYALLASAVSAATSSRDPASTQAHDLSNSGTLIPPSVHGADRLSFIAAQRERLSILLSALDKEASTLQEEKTPGPRNMPSMFFDGSSGSEEEEKERPKSATSGLSKSRSEADFEKIDAESGTEEVENSRRQGKSSSGSWLPWSWGAKAEETADVDTVMSEASSVEDKGKSSAVDT
jgi:receptor expression-enhancing protein 1/2/3/4